MTEQQDDWGTLFWSVLFMFLGAGIVVAWTNELSAALLICGYGALLCGAVLLVQAARGWWR